MIANWSPACAPAVWFVSPFAELIVVPLTEVLKENVECAECAGDSFPPVRLAKMLAEARSDNPFWGLELILVLLGFATGTGK